MKTLDAFVAEKRELTVHTLVSYARDYVRDRWQVVLEDNREEMLDLFARAGDPAYGVFSRKLFGSLREELLENGLTLDPDFPGSLPRSLEQWGPPEFRERCMWCVVRQGDGPALGTIVTRIFHDHTRFRIPAAPVVFALDASDDDQIRSLLADASVRLRSGEMIGVHAAAGGGEGTWEYAVEIGLGDALDSGRPQFVEGLLDGPLQVWGRYGWELTNVVSHQGRLLAFFKRPKKG